MKKVASDPLKTILVIVIGFLVVYLITKLPWSLYVATSVGVLGLASGYMAKKIDFLWMKLTWLLGMIVPNILLSVIFYLFLTPIAWVSRLFQKEDQLYLKNKSASIFKDSNKSFDHRSFENPW